MERSTRRRDRMGLVALAGALGAVLASSLCCVLPLVLVSIGITGPWLARLRFFDPYRVPFEAISLAALAAAWAIYLARRRSCRPESHCVEPRRRQTLAALFIATAIIGALVAAPYALAWFGGL